jgi:hypothetical protein
MNGDDAFCAKCGQPRGYPVRPLPKRHTEVRASAKPLVASWAWKIFLAALTVPLLIALIVAREPAPPYKVDISHVTFHKYPEFHVAEVKNNCSGFALLAEMEIGHGVETRAEANTLEFFSDRINAAFVDRFVSSNVLLSAARKEGCAIVGFYSEKNGAWVYDITDPGSEPRRIK